MRPYCGCRTEDDVKAQDVARRNGGAMQSRSNFSDHVQSSKPLWLSATVVQQLLFGGSPQSNTPNWIWPVGACRRVYFSEWFLAGLSLPADATQAILTRPPVQHLAEGLPEVQQGQHIARSVRRMSLHKSRVTSDVYHDLSLLSAPISPLP